MMDAESATEIKLTVRKRHQRAHQMNRFRIITPRQWIRLSMAENHLLSVGLGHIAAQARSNPVAQPKHAPAPHAASMANDQRA
tara:strand:- start:842 stop:1090 length:249 start_codon:yes stop_codon:yes gene_type:complete